MTNQHIRRTVALSLNLGIELPLFLDLLLLLLLLKLMLERHLCVKFPFKPIMFGIS